MRNKSTVIALLLVFTGICFYNLFYTYKQFNMESQIAEVREPAIIVQDKPDSLWTKEDSLADANYDSLQNNTDFQTEYKTAVDRSFTLGLDLQGGMYVTLEVGVGDILKQMAGENKEDPDFIKSIECANERAGEVAQAFVPLFVECFQENAVEGRKLGEIFADPDREISIASTDAEVIAMLEEEANSAIDRTFDVVRTRIDQFGVVSPNLNKSPNTNRILLELPGVKEPERVRALLRSTAKLEFWTTHPWYDVYPVMNQINTQLARDAGVLDSTVQDSADIDPEVAEAGDEAADDEVDPDSTAVASDSTTADSNDTDITDVLGDSANATTDLTPEEIEEQRRKNPLYARLFVFDPNQRQGSNSPIVGQANASDTLEINNFFKRESVKPLIPKDMRFAWGFKPVAEGTNVFNLFAIKTNEDNLPSLGGDAVSQARQDFGQQGQPSVSLQMNAEGAETWGRLTRANVNYHVAILLDDKVYSAPVVQGAIMDGNSQINGDFTIDEAKDLANVLKAGKLPAPAKIAGEETVGPTLGAENIQDGLRSFMIAFIVILIFMVIYYSSSGVIADLALLANMIFILGCSAAFTIVLTLPGMAAVVLTIGMAIDANVLIFERIREEQAKDKTLKASIKAGFSNAFSSVMDANITTFLTGVVLYAFGVGPIRGFAVSLMIGIITSLISALIITRLMLDYYANRGGTSINFGFSWTTGLFDKAKIRMTDRKKFFYTVSLALIVASFALFATVQFKTGVDFNGGRQFKISLFDSDSTNTYPLSSAEVSAVRTSLGEAFGNTDPVVKTVSRDYQLMIVTDYLLKEGGETEEVQKILEDAVTSALPGKEVGVDSVQDVSATVATDIRRAAYMSVLFSLMIIFFYILVRFRKWQYSAGAIAAIFHDVVIVLGIYSFLSMFENLWFNVEINQNMIAALLTIIGYSINDTVVVFDRIRENIGEMKSAKLGNIYNISIDQTISRTLITSVTTFITLLILFIWGGDSLRGFVFAIMVGVVVGTYSSIFVASPISLDLIKRQQAEAEK